MPLYAYACPCGGYAETWRKVDQRHESPACPDCSEPTTLVIRAPRVMSDIEPYQAVAVDVATGKPPMITSRSQHREFLRRNGLVELGNDVKVPDRKSEPSKKEIAADVRAAIEQVRAGKGAGQTASMVNVFGDGR